MLTFAYGSNLNRRAMARRCPQAKPLTTARLAGYRLVFRGYADIVPDKTGVVQGALYTLTPACLRALDDYEDVPALYRRITVTVETDDGPREAFAYVMTAENAPVQPPDVAAYNEIAVGYREWKLDAKLLQRARLAVLHPQRDSDATRRALLERAASSGGDERR